MTWQQVRRALCPEPARRPAYARGLNIAFRTFHIAVTGVLLGGHAFDVPAATLRPMLWLVIVSGAGLVALETYKTCDWIHQGWGALLLLKLVLLCLIPFAWKVRVPILLAVVVIASVGSHMPRSLRHYSFVHRRVLKS